MKSIYINPEGIVCYLPDCPEEPTIIEIVGLPRGRSRFKQRLAYEMALQAAKDSAVPFKDQKQAKKLLFEKFCIFPAEYKDGVEYIRPLPSGWDVKIMYDSPLGLIEGSPYATDKKVAVLIPPPTSEQEETALDLKMFIERELGGYKTVHMGRSYRVINRQFVYESDIMSLAEDLLRNFTITRNLKENQ